MRQPRRNGRTDHQLELLAGTPPPAATEPTTGADERRHPNGTGTRRVPIGRPPLPRLSVSPDEAAAVLGVSRDYFDKHILCELRTVRRGRRILIPVHELERWLECAATRTTGTRRA